MKRANGISCSAGAEGWNAAYEKLKSMGNDNVDFQIAEGEGHAFFDHFGDQIGSMAESDFFKGEESLRRDAGIETKRERSSWENPARISPPPRSAFLPTLKNSMLPI